MKMINDPIRLMRNSQEMINIVPRSNPSQCKFPRTGKRGVPQQFPRRLYEMLETETKNKEASAAYQSIISWSLSGKAFRIVNVSDFASTILPKYFRTTKFSSFQRNLNLYGFAKVRHGADTDMYAHPSFFRNNPDALFELRKVSGSTGSLSTTASSAINDGSNEANSCMDIANGFQTQKEARRSVSPSYSSSSNVSSPSTPMEIECRNKLLVPSKSAVNDMIVSAPLPLCYPPIVSPTVQREIVNAQIAMVRRDNVHGQNANSIRSTNDRGRLDLLTLALEYECQRVSK